MHLEVSLLYSGWIPNNAAFPLAHKSYAHARPGYSERQSDYGCERADISGYCKLCTYAKSMDIDNNVMKARVGVGGRWEEGDKRGKWGTSVIVWSIKTKLKKYKVAFLNWNFFFQILALNPIPECPWACLSIVEHSHCSADLSSSKWGCCFVAQ